MHKLGRNLAQSHIDAQDAIVRAELESVGIPVVGKVVGFRDPVSCSLAGRMAAFELLPGPESWLVMGNMSGEQAAELRTMVSADVMGLTHDGGEPLVTVRAVKLEIKTLEGLKIFADFVRGRFM